MAGSVNASRPSVAQERHSNTRKGKGETYAVLASRFPFLVSRFPRNPFLQLLPELHPLSDRPLISELARLVPFLSPQHLRQVILRHVGVVERMRVLVPRTVSQLLHELGRGIADVQRHGLGGMRRGGIRGMGV